MTFVIYFHTIVVNSILTTKNYFKERVNKFYKESIMKKVYFIMLFAIFSILMAQDVIFEMSLEELLNMTVVTASKKSQDIGFAPADMIVINSDMIQERGYHDLKDVFRDLPGFDISENVEGEVRTLIINRGILGNNKIMILKDGKKLNTSTGERFVYGNNIPLFDVKQIEIIYGPSSAMYGADAYAGVVNMISKTPEDIDGYEVSFGVGTQNTFDESVLIGKQINDDISVMGSFRKYNTAGFNPSNYDEYKNANVSASDIDMPTDNYNIYGKVLIKDFLIGFYRMDATEPNGYSTNPAWYSLDKYYVWHQVIDKVFFEHNYKLDKFNLTSTLEYSDYEVKNESTFHYTWGHQYKYAKSNAIKWEEKIDMTLPMDINFSSGFAYEQINSFPKTANLNTKFNTDVLVDDMSLWYVDGKIFGLPEMESAPAIGLRPFSKFGVYGELTKKLSETVQINGGVRYDQSSNYEPKNIYNLISPRFGLIWNPEKTTVKLLYGEAYIQPSEYDKWENFVVGNTLAHIPNPNLESENLRNVTSVLKHEFSSNFVAEASIYYNQLKDIIRPQVYTDNNVFIDSLMADDAFIETNSNVGEQTTMGMEVRLQYVTKKLKAYLYYSFLQAKEKNGDPISKISPHKLQLGATYKFMNKYSFTPRIRFIGKANGLGNSGVEEGYFDSRTVFDLSLTGTNVYDKLSFELNVINLLDTEYYAPVPFGEGPGGWLMYKAPQPERSMQVMLHYKI